MNDQPVESALKATCTVTDFNPENRMNERACTFGKPSEPCTFVILGASGDLTARKLIPSLYNLFINDGLPDRFAIVGCARTALTHDTFREAMKSNVSLVHTDPLEKWEMFAAHLFYIPVDYESLDSFRKLGEAIRLIERENNPAGNRIYYLALPMFLYEPVVRMIGLAGLAKDNERAAAWIRVAVEKPFGTDLRSARALNSSIQEYFKEDQIFRIDHYLTKETVQNILMLRFANTIFEPLWNRGYIDRVKILASETIGVERRAGYYEKAGIIRDMLQNHMMQLLALTAMEPPSIFESGRVHEEKSKVFHSLRPFPVENIEQNIVLGQYTRGIIDGSEVPAYRGEPHVDPDSITPTFGTIKVFVDNWRWQDVPFYLTSGKRLAQKLTGITIQFKHVPHSMFRNVLSEQIAANSLTLGIQPEEKVTLQFQAKSPRAHFSLRLVTMDFNYLQNYKGPVLDAYEKALLDLMEGDQMLFWRQDALELCWEFFDPVLTACETCFNPLARLHFYEAGTWGPAAAQALKESKSVVR